MRFELRESKLPFIIAPYTGVTFFVAPSKSDSARVIAPHCTAIKGAQPRILYVSLTVEMDQGCQNVSILFATSRDELVNAGTTFEITGAGARFESLSDDVAAERCLWMSLAACVEHAQCLSKLFVVIERLHLTTEVYGGSGSEKVPGENC